MVENTHDGPVAVREDAAAETGLGVDESAPEVDEGSHEPVTTIFGSDVGVLGWADEEDGSPFLAELYVSDGEERATLPLTPEVLGPLIDWLAAVDDAQRAVWGLAPAAGEDRAAGHDEEPAVHDADEDLVDEHEVSRVKRAARGLAKGASVASGWGPMDRLWSAATPLGRAALVAVVAALVVAGALLTR